MLLRKNSAESGSMVERALAMPEALCRRDPEGIARVHGEISQVRVADGTTAIAAGAPVRVREVHGLRLLVEPVGTA